MAIGCALAIMSVRGIFGGEVAPAFWRGLGPFDRKRHPKSFRATLLWNGALAAALLVSVPLTWLQDLEDRCAQRDGRQPGVAALSACNRIIGMSFLPVDVRARALALRGRYHALNDNIDLALADFEKAVRTDPDDPVLRVYRAHGFALSGDHERFEHEVAAASRLGLEKGLVASIAGMEHLNHRRYDLAIAELTISLEIRPDNANDLVLRGIAYSESGQEALARRDFEAASKLAPADPARLRGMADFARERENYPSALSYINQYLRLYPRDIEAIKDRSDIYWKLGMEDESRRDDDRAWELQDEQATAAR
ncbi:tetratricopeptide repeat protein [Croceicoccus sp. BE223]|uniref:tetratricopeptide repeat protein n=1 Tax=Croceicoccus sp. BE223 TaxID=2817716 RepID=UPI00286353AE|nr:tetratricopeptide repeat protein [Croceicoccus sp. BE223]MDR7101069.1 Flp pilus assembly protein TadD [Croceicoccus sp. BE223]